MPNVSKLLRFSLLFALVCIVTQGCRDKRARMRETIFSSCLKSALRQVCLYHRHLDVIE